MSSPAADGGGSDGDNATTFSCAHVSAEIFDRMWPIAANAIRRAAFVALDLEFSGLHTATVGRSDMMHPDMDMRYRAMRSVATENSVVELGLVAFERADPDPLESGGGGARYRVSAFEFLTLNERSFRIGGSTGAFLVSEGFDFNALFAHGIKYTPPHEADGEDSQQPSWGSLPSSLGDSASQQTDAPPPRTLASLITVLREAGTTLIVHNGLLDLLFLLNHFVGVLPDTLTRFVSCVIDCFPCVVDTKFLTEVMAPHPASFLAYVYHRMQRENARRPPSAAVTFAHSKAPADSARFALSADATAADTPVSPPLPCGRFALRGFCPDGRACARSHDINVILDAEEKERAGRRSRKRARTTPVPAAPASPQPIPPAPPALPAPPTAAQPQQHHAGWDAYCTGCVYTFFLAQYGEAAVAARAKRLRLAKKGLPLLLERSQFA